MAKKAKRKVPRQTEIDGARKVVHKDIDDGTHAYANAKAAFREAGEEMKESHDALADLMAKHKLEVYRTETGKLVRASSRRRVSVKDADKAS